MESDKKSKKLFPYVKMVVKNEGVHFNRKACVGLFISTTTKTYIAK